MLSLTIETRRAERIKSTNSLLWSIHACDYNERICAAFDEFRLFGSIEWVPPWVIVICFFTIKKWYRKLMQFFSVCIVFGSVVDSFLQIVLCNSVKINDESEDRPQCQSSSCAEGICNYWLLFVVDAPLVPPNISTIPYL